MGGGGVKVFLVIYLLSVHSISFVWSAHGSFCFSVDGHSPGSQNFCERCENETRNGLGIFWRGNIGMVYNNVGSPPNFINGDDVGVSVTTITIDGVELEGWFHIKLTMPTTQPAYAFMIQVEDNTALRTTGEMTTDLLSACEDENLANVPTAAQILPCHATAKSGIMVSNAVVYEREASSTDGTIRSRTPPTEYHVNWKIPPSFSCSASRTFYVRAILVSLPGMQSITAATQCPDEGRGIPCIVPQSHHYNKIRIHLPPFGDCGEYTYAHPIPPFMSDTSKVDCHVPMPMDPPDPTVVFKPYLTIPVTPDTNTEWIAGPSCVQGNGFIPPGEPPFNASAAKQPLRSLYFGRCTERVPAEGGANLSFACASPTDPDDVSFLTSLPTLTKYIEDVRYDVCNCDMPEIPQPDGGSLNFVGKGSSGPSPTTPPPDYPSIGDGGGGGPVSTGITGNESSTSLKIPQGPLQKILNKVGRLYFIHGLFYSIAFLFLIPISIFSARYLKETFYNPEAVVDIWYRIHLVGIAGTFVCFMIGEFVLLAGNSYAVILEPTEASSSGSHGGIGALVIILFTALVITGGVRPFNPNSNVGLKITIFVHGLLGFLFYFLGLITMILACLWNPGESAGMITIIVVWIVLDIVCHIIMTVFVMKKDRPSELATSGFPVMELVYDHRSAPGEGARKKLFYIYIVLCVIFTLTACIHSLPLITSDPSSTLNFNRTVNMKWKNNQNGSQSGFGGYF